jgi:hypothetical protein
VLVDTGIKELCKGKVKSFLLIGMILFGLKAELQKLAKNLLVGLKINEVLK